MIMQLSHAACNKGDRMNIYQRLNKVRQAVGYVQRDKSVDGRYSVATYDQIVSHIRAAMVEHGVVVQFDQLSGEFLRDIPTKSGGVQFLYGGSYRVDLVNADDPTDRASSVVYSHAIDNGDKAPGKAITYAVKAAINKALLLETGDDEESRHETRAQREPITSDEVALLNGLIEETETDVQKFLSALSKAGKATVVRIEDIPASDLAWCVGMLQAKVAKLRKS